MKLQLKMLLALTFCFASMTLTNAKRLDVNLAGLPAKSENTEWVWNETTQTGVFSWSATSWNSTELFGAGNYSDYTTLNLITEDGSSNHYRLIVRYTNGAGQTTVSLNTGTVSLTWEQMGIAVANIPHIQTIRLSGASDNAADIKVKSIYLEGPDINYIEATKQYEAPEGTTDVKDLTGTEAKWAETVTYPKEFAVQEKSFGNGDGSSESTHVTISDYDYISFVVTEASENSVALRVWIWDDVNNRVATLYAYPEVGCDTITKWETEYRITAPGVYVTRVSGYKYLKGVKAANNWGAPPVKVSMAYMSKGDKPVSYTSPVKYLLVGATPGSLSLQNALADENALIYDGIGLTNTEAVSLEPANPNALFLVADANKLNNNNNVSVAGNIANLVVTDGYPMAVPDESTTSTAASYTRNMSNQYGTICLPFAANATEDVKFYAIDEIDGKDLVISEINTLNAGTPAIVEKTDDSASQITVTGSGSLAKAGSEEGEISFYGTFMAKTILAEDYEQSIYAISNNKFIKATSQINLPAFRAFFTAENANGEVNIRQFDDDDTPTAIDNIVSSDYFNIMAVYGLDGARRSSLSKGMNIVRMANGTTMKVLVK